MYPLQIHRAAILILGIVGSAFVTEDGATISAATLAAASVLDARLAFASAFFGLWAGDLLVYALAFRMGSRLATRRWFARWIAKPDSSTRQTSILGLGLSRFFPGTRLPMYVSAGLNRMPLWSFAIVTAISASVWTLLIFQLIHSIPAISASLQRGLASLAIFGFVLFLALAFWRKSAACVYARLQLQIEKCLRWEFWPAWLFYIPVFFFCARLAIRYRGFSLPAIANLNQKNGGIIGESKVDILRELSAVVPQETAAAALIEPAELSARLARVEEIRTQFRIEFPFVLKPDTAQRGAGFRKICSSTQAEQYLAQVHVPVVLQKYVPGPNEAGIFYYRLPNQAAGEILGITRKIFPVVVGDGTQTLRQLIESDSRARFLVNTYARRLANRMSSVPEPGETVRLVEAGNHCQGCEFRDGADLYTEQLRAAFDRISQKLNGFYIGRFDIRYESDESLGEGKGFQIIELNGAASEATNIYDSRNSLLSAYATLYRQWQLVYAIGAVNRKLGHQTPSVFSIWKDWRQFSAAAGQFPVAD